MYSALGVEQEKPSFSDRWNARMRSHHLPTRRDTHDGTQDGYTFRNSLPQQGHLNAIPPTYQSTEALGSGPPLNFANQIPQENAGAHPTTTKPYRQETTSTTSRSTLKGSRRSIATSIAWPIIAVTLPIALLSSSLLVLVFGYQVHTEQSLFKSQSSRDGQSDSLFLFVDYSATRLVFVASFLSTLAPILSSFIMTLWSRSVAKSMRESSLNHDMLKLPTPYQLSLVVGLTLASADRLRTYFRYMCSRSRKTHIPPVLHCAAAILSLSIILAGAVFAADTALHYYTTTIDFDRLSPSTSSSHELGRGLPLRCLDFDRTKNGGFPCSLPAVTMDIMNETFAQAATEQNDIFLLTQNVSTRSEIRILDKTGPNNSGLAVLIPSHEHIPSNLDFRASTIAVSTRCSLVTPRCKPHYLSDGTGETSFHCSNEFYGLLGNNVTLDSSGGSFLDPDASPLMYKPATSLDYSYYSDANLTHLYNTVGYFAANLSAGAPPLPDDELVNPIFLGLAGRFPELDEAYGSNLHEQTGFFSSPEANVVDFVLSCEITSYDADYTWVSGSIDDVSFSATTNGSVLEIFHGRQLYGGLAAGADLQNMMLQAISIGTEEAFLSKWAESLSIKVLSTIGAYTDTRSTLQEQTRTRLLVARVPKAALGALIGCSLMYTILGIGLGVMAYRASTADVQDLAAQLSLPGLTAAAFEQKGSKPGDTASGSRDNLSLTNWETRGESRRILVDGNPENGYEFRAWV